MSEVRTNGDNSPEFISGFSLERHIQGLVDSGHILEAESDITDIIRDSYNPTPQAVVVDVADYWEDVIDKKNAVVLRYKPDEENGKALAVLCTESGLYVAPYIQPDEYDGTEEWPYWPRRTRADEKVASKYLPQAARIIDEYHMQADGGGKKAWQDDYFTDSHVDKKDNYSRHRVATLWIFEPSDPSESGDEDYK